MRIYRIDNFKAKFSGLPEEEEIARGFLSLEKENSFFYSPFDKFHRFYNKDNEFDYGLSFKLKQQLEEKNIKVKLVDFDLYSGKINVDIDCIDERLHLHQKEGVVEFFKNDFGVLVFPTRGGKTFSAAECIKIAKENGYKNFLFFVDGIDLFKQTVREFSKYFNIPESEIGQINNSDDVVFKEINIATIQTITSMYFPKESKNDTKEKKRKRNKNKSDLLKFLSSVDFLIVDEIHEYSSKKRVRIIKRCKNIKFFLGLSATPYKSENEKNNFTVRGYSGDVIYTVTEDILIERGVLVQNKVFIILFRSKNLPALKNVNDSFYIDTLENFIVEEDERNELIIFLIKLFEELTLKTLVMFTRVFHGKKIADRTGKIFLSGEDKIDYREETKEEFLQGEGKVLLSSDIYKKGVSLNSCKVLVNASDGLEQSKAIQRRGRILASSEGKTKALVVDIFDNMKYFDDHSLSRLEAYEKVVGEENIIVFDFNDKDFLSKFKEEVKRYFYD